jgi:hypothetical protein
MNIVTEIFDPNPGKQLRQIAHEIDNEMAVAAAGLQDPDRAPLEFRHPLPDFGVKDTQ